MILQHSLADCTASTHYLPSAPRVFKITARQLKQDRTYHPDTISDIMTGETCRWKYKGPVKHRIYTFTELI